MRETIFPGNASPATSDDPLQPRSSAEPAKTAPSDAETHDRIRRSQRAAAMALLNCVPRPFAVFYYGAGGAVGRGSSEAGSAEERRAKLEKENEYMIEAVTRDILVPFENEVVNRHLVYAITELVVGYVFPELAVGADGDEEGSVAKLLEERGVEIGGGG